MTLKGLLAYFENYYGEKYTGAFLKTMVDYLDGDSENFYEAMAKVMVKRFSRVYNKVPDVAEIEKNMSEIMDTLERPLMLPECSYQESEEDNIKWHEMCQNFLKQKGYL